MGLVTGMLLTLAWLAGGMRIQMKLKLRYFQARYLERELGLANNGIYKDEGSFFGKERELKSPDGTKTLRYPKNLDGFFAKINPSIWEWFLPLIFFATFATLLGFLILYM